MGYSATIESGVRDSRFRGVIDEDEAIDMMVSRKSYKNENQSKRQTRRNSSSRRRSSTKRKKQGGSR